MGFCFARREVLRPLIEPRRRWEKVHRVLPSLRRSKHFAARACGLFWCRGFCHARSDLLPLPFASRGVSVKWCTGSCHRSAAAGASAGGTDTPFRCMGFFPRPGTWFPPFSRAVAPAGNDAWGHAPAPAAAWLAPGRHGGVFWCMGSCPISALQWRTPAIRGTGPGWAIGPGFLSWSGGPIVAASKPSAARGFRVMRGFGDRVDHCPWYVLLGCCTAAARSMTVQ